MLIFNCLRVEPVLVLGDKLLSKNIAVATRGLYPFWLIGFYRVCLVRYPGLIKV